MSSSSLVGVALYQSYQEASMAQAALTAEAVESELVGGVTADTLAYYGTATGGVTLLVRQEDAARAGRILDEIGRRRDAEVALPPWRCPDCGELVEGGFDLCWSCGELKPDVHQDVEAEIQSNPEGHATPVDPAELGGRWTETEMDRTAPESADAMLDRAWRAAVLGIAFFPLLPYAWLLAFRASDVPSQQTSWKFYGTLAIVCGMGLCWWMFLSGFGWR